MLRRPDEQDPPRTVRIDPLALPWTDDWTAAERAEYREDARPIDCVLGDGPSAVWHGQNERGHWVQRGQTAGLVATAERVTATERVPTLLRETLLTLYEERTEDPPQNDRDLRTSSDSWREAPVHAALWRMSAVSP